MPSGCIEGIRKSTWERGTCKSVITLSQFCKNLNNHISVPLLHSPAACAPKGCPAVMRLSRSCEIDRDTCSGNFTIKALRWWQKIAGVSHLSICFSSLVDSFLKTKLSKDRREAPLLPHSIIFHWERRILQGVATPYEVIMLGLFLLITWSGLRFADAQRLSIESLVFNFQELRGCVEIKDDGSQNVRQLRFLSRPSCSVTLVNFYADVVAA